MTHVILIIRIVKGVDCFTIDSASNIGWRKDASVSVEKIVPVVKAKSYNLFLI